MPDCSALLTLPPSGVPGRRLRWYSLAEYVYSESLTRMINVEAQEQAS